MYFMKKLITLSVLLCATTLCNAQKIKVDLDRFYFNVSFQNLPSLVIPSENRTYTVSVITDGPISNQFPHAKVLSDKIKIHGWKKVAENGAMTIKVNLADFFQESRKTETRTVEEKKDGKVVNSYPMYTIVTNYRGKGYVTLNAPKASNIEDVAVVAKPEAPKSNNRFLKNANTEATKVVQDDATTKNLNYSQDFTYKSAENTNLRVLEKQLSDNYEGDYNLRLRNYVDYVLSNVNSNLNATYGFAPSNFQEQLWIMDSKEEEGTIQKEAIEAVKQQFATMKANESIEKLTSDLQPLIEYFQSLKSKYIEDNKGCKKIRYSAFYNLGKIYLYLDQPEKAIKEGEGLIANDYDEGDGKDIIAAANKLIKRFNETKLTSRHNPIYVE